MAVDAFCGMGALLITMCRNRRRVVRYFGVDNDPLCGLLLIRTAEYCMEHYPECMQWEAVAHMFTLWGDIRDLREERLEAVGPASVFGCGSPCQDFSRASRAPKGLAGDRSVLILYDLQLRNWCCDVAERHGEKCHWYFENVYFADVLPADAQLISQWAGAEFVVFCSGRISTCSRERCWWVSPELGLEPPTFYAGGTLAEALEVCGGKHIPRLAPFTDNSRGGTKEVFNVEGEPMLVAACVVAREDTWSHRMPPHGTGTGLH